MPLRRGSALSRWAHCHMTIRHRSILIRLLRVAGFALGLWYIWTVLFVFQPIESMDTLVFVLVFLYYVQKALVGILLALPWSRVTSKPLWLALSFVMAIVLGIEIFRNSYDVVSAVLKRPSMFHVDICVSGLFAGFYLLQIWSILCIRRYALSNAKPISKNHSSCAG